MSEGGGRINVSIDKLRVELVQLELRLVDRITREISTKAEAAEVQSLRHSVKTLEAQRPLGDRLMGEFLDVKREVDSLKTWRAWLTGISSAAGFAAGATALRVFFGIG